MRQKKKEKYKYAFPNIMAVAMSKIDMRTQMESSMMSQFLLLIGLSIMVVYMSIYNQGAIFYKIVLIFNLVCGWILISSYLVTTYQQYTSYMSALNIDPAEEKRKVRARGNIFKRIRLAIQNRKKKKETIPTPQLVKDALENQKIINKEREKDMKKLENEADKLRKEELENEKEQNKKDN